jgi:hypothetical protein
VVIAGMARATATGVVGATAAARGKLGFPSKRTMATVACKGIAINTVMAATGVAAVAAEASAVGPVTAIAGATGMAMASTVGMARAIVMGRAWAMVVAGGGR